MLSDTVPGYAAPLSSFFIENEHELLVAMKRSGDNRDDLRIFENALNRILPTIKTPSMLTSILHQFNKYNYYMSHSTIFAICDRLLEMPLVFSDIRGILMGMRYKTVMRNLPKDFWTRLEAKLALSDFE
jgi:hypothetical protein